MRLVNVGWGSPLRIPRTFALAGAALALLACGGCTSEATPVDDVPSAADEDAARVSGGSAGHGNARGTNTANGVSSLPSGLASSHRTGESGGSGGGTSGGTEAPGCGGSALQPAAAATVSGFIDTLPYAPANDAKRAQIIDAILKTCEVFAPPSATGFTKKHCYAHLAAAIHKESTYNPASSVTDAYATRAIGNAKANDPTVGLLQIRFSSTVHDFVEHGPLDALSCAGCTFPEALATHANESGDSTFWAVTGPTAYKSVLTSPACNVALGAWYYYVNATGNGSNATTTYIDGYCNGSGTPANLITGLRSHLNGPSGGRGVIADMNGLAALSGTDWGGYQYVTTIKTWFDGMIGQSAGKHPFFLTLPSERTALCR